MCSVEDQFKFIMNLQWNYMLRLKKIKTGNQYEFSFLCQASQIIRYLPKLLHIGCEVQILYILQLFLGLALRCKWETVYKPSRFITKWFQLQYLQHSYFPFIIQSL